MTVRLAHFACSFVALGAATRAAEAPAPKADDPIIIIGERTNGALGDIRAATQLDENAIAAYGADTVGELLGALATGPDPSGEGPYILINGEPASGIDDIADLPAEAASKIQLLSRNAAALLGQRPTRRVINVVIKPNHRQLTLNGKGGLATAGEVRKGEGEVNLLRLTEGNRRSLVLRVSDRDSLLEADRDIIAAPLANSYDSLGNPISVTDLGRYRTLLPGSFIVSANGNVTQRLGRNLLSMTLRGDHQQSDARIGPATAEFNLPASSPFSPFAGDVTVAQIIGGPLTQASRSTSLTGAAVLNGPLGTWRYSINANLTRRSSLSRSQQGYDLAALQAGIDAGSVNPFLAPDPLLLGDRRVARARGVATNGGIQASFNGSPFKLPAGAARLSLRLEQRFNRARSSNSGLPGERRLRRNEALGAANAFLPLITSKAFGSIGLELSGAVHHVTASGWLRDYGYGLTWDPNSRLSIRAAINREQIAPPSNALTDPLISIDNVRTYDFIRQETVFVTYLTGGNPGLGIERRRTTSIGATWQPFDEANLSINVDYQGFRGRNAFAALPPVNADVQAAFPDRFQRDLSGRLIAVDARPVPFDLVKRDELRWGATFSRNFGVVASPGPKTASEDGAALVSGWRTNVFFQHSWTLASTRRARSGLPTIDLLDGGAIGYGGGVPRHQIQFGGGVVHRGIGLQVDGDITGSSRVATGTLASPDTLRFASRALVDARLFVNLGPQLPGKSWAKGARISFGVENMFDSKARVRDGSGNTPIGYQPYLIDPLGRVVTLALRKVF